MMTKHSLYEIWKEGYVWKLKVRGNVLTFGSYQRAINYKWACLRPGK